MRPAPHLPPGLCLTVRPDVQRVVSQIYASEARAPEHRKALFAPRAEASILVRWGANGAPAVSVLGPLIRGHHKSFTAPRRMIQVFFRAGRSRALLGVAVHEVTGRIVAIDDLWGDSGARLRDELASSDLPRALSLLQDALAERVRTSDAPASRARLLSGAMQHLEQGSERIATIADELGVSERHLRRLFHDDLGITPKQYGRIARLRRVLLHDRPATSWSQLAIESGYFDQSHMIREFGDLLQVTPVAFFAAAHAAFRRP